MARACLNKKPGLKVPSRKIKATESLQAQRGRKPSSMLGDPDGAVKKEEPFLRKGTRSPMESMIDSDGVDDDSEGVNRHS